MQYNPQPIDTSHVQLDPGLSEVIESIAEQVHDVWAHARLQEGWVYGPIKNSDLKTTPLLVPYQDLPESEKDYDRNSAMETIKLLTIFGYTISKNA